MYVINTNVNNSYQLLFPLIQLNLIYTPILSGLITKGTLFGIKNIKRRDLYRVIESCKESKFIFYIDF